MSDLAGFTSAIILTFVTLYVFYESIIRLFNPVPIIYNQAIWIAFVGLIVNILSAKILHGNGDHTHDHEHSHAPHETDLAHHHHHHDNNFRAAYIHIIADAVTSVAALLALFCGLEFGWSWMDPAMGIVGAGVILSWVWRLLCDTSTVLLDRDSSLEKSERISHVLADKGVQICDLHTWRVGHDCYAAILTVSAPKGVIADQVRGWLHPLRLAHVTIEVVQT